MNLATVPDQRAARAPGAPAVADDRLNLDNTQFLDAVCRAAAVLRARGVASGDVVALMLPNRAEFVVALFAAWRLGAAVTPISPTLVPAEVAHQLTDAGAKVLIVDRIPMPENEELAETARRRHIITDASRGVTIGHGIIIRADSWGDRELMLHQLVHVAQCERSGGLEAFVQQYLCDRQTCATFTVGSLEEEARGIAREICATDTATEQV